ncbi:hypothetical protein ARMGADRAFT_118009 [Armillaria gallica]|uniref:Uncharacterized protein n=1 Tax=Armillaria gallica TaxID=47427 RepID=A0A2H3CCT0_ARMGA|nr:hypothetical protein ARMGADRAFT_118009 [Armillaria gallica]
MHRTSRSPFVSSREKTPCHPSPTQYSSAFPLLGGKNLDFIFPKPETITALDAVHGRLDVAHFFFWLSWVYCGHALVSGAMPYFCGSADLSLGGFTL